MPLIRVTGRTFAYREVLKRLGAKWESASRGWLITVSETVVNELRSKVGLSVAVMEAPPISDDHWSNRHLYEPAPVIYGDDPTYYNYFRDQDPIAYGGFSSLGKFVDHVAGLEMPRNTAGRCDIGWTAKPEYAGTVDMTQALDIARIGWLDGLGMAKDLLPPDPTVKRRKRALAGGAVNVGRMLAGMPDHMVRRQTVKGDKIITIFVETVMWEGININTALTRVVAICAIIDRLEQKGYSCNVVAVYSALRRDNYKPYQTVVTLKDAGERLSLADISFALGHPSFGRRLVYASEGMHPQCNLAREIRGRISQAFDNEYKPRANEFYIPQILENITDIWEIMELIKPDDLPIEINR